MNEKVYNALFGARVKYYREKLGMTQKDLAEKLGYTSHASIAKIEKGDNSIPLSKLPDFCSILRVHPYDLIGLNENDKKIWMIAEKMEKDSAGLQSFISVYLKLLEGGK